MSNERSSLVHERCTTCGSLLPCVLHDREMKKAVLRERDEIPRFEKVWEGEAKRVNLLNFTTWLSDSCFVTISYTGNVNFAEWNEEAKKWDESYVDLNHLIGPRRTLTESGFKSATLLKDGKILIAVNDGQLILFNPQKRVDGSFESEIIREGDSKYSFWKFDNLSPLDDGSCLALRNGTYEQNKKFLCRLFSKGIRWESRDIFDPRHHFVDQHIYLLQSLSSGEFIVSTIDRTGKSARTRKYVLIPPKHDLSTDWSYHEIIMPDGLDFPNDKLIAWLSTVEPEFISCENNTLYHFRQCSSNPQMLEKRPIGRSSNVSEYDAIYTLCDRVVIAAGSSGKFHQDGRLECWMRDDSGIWRQQADADWEVGRLISAISSPGDSKSFIAQSQDSLFTPDRTLFYYRFSSDKLQTYHEHQAAQIKPPPLPSDL